MNNCTRIVGATTALMLGLAANADLQYGDAILSAESHCFMGVQHETVQRPIAFAGDHLSTISSCGGGSTTAFIETAPDWFILSAGSTAPGMPTEGEKAPVLVDAGNGPGAVELAFTIDRPTLFRMQRCLPGTTVIFWDDDYQIAVLDSADEVTPLPAGSYWATLETDQYGTPTWAQIDWSQQEDSDPADINGDGKVNAQDIADQVSRMSESKPGTNAKESDGTHTTGGECTKDDAASSKQVKGRGDRKDKPVTGGFTPLPKPKPGSMKGKPNSQASEGKGPQVFFEAPNKETKSRRKGDFDRNGKIDIHDIVYLIGRM